MMNHEDIDTLASLLEGTKHAVSRLSNAAAFINGCLDDVCWVGFYLCDESGDLYLGPFQGKPACIQIKRGRGVCGTALAENRTVIVPDVREFPGYISCDAAAMSEVVIPMHDGNGNVIAVLDIDSSTAGRFTQDGSAGQEINILEEIAELILEESE
ncbi:MAG: GAF domain-containing protein [Porcincola intestinalis]|uniref:GAF domain-containing protein n=1 Tax=Porcincola intestinalis TaxID=2606632 RepID=UPI002A91410C|nr:GAF domain-containing protein [Porcincola intestinalis]MDY5331593.1 GAF domain-containing protein [Porcincola intestinalis]